MTIYQPVITIFKNEPLKQFHIHFFVPLANANESILLKSGQPKIIDNHRVFEYDVVTNGVNVASDVHIISEKNGVENIDIDDCHSVKIVIDPPNGGIKKNTQKQYSEAKK
ncbi:MAG: hypothetical protein JXQ87_07315 [Bacteroidia bacterium]